MNNLSNLNPRLNLNINDFFMLAEWAPHRATWLAWPYDEITFPERVAKVEKIFATIIYYLHQVELVELLVLDQEMQRRATSVLKEQHVAVEKIRFHIVDYADVWMRDYGPTFLARKDDGGGQRCAEATAAAWTKWQYNAYGAKFPDLLRDNYVPYQIQDDISLPFFEAGFIMEGGAIDVNGKGTVLTTCECLLNENRNRHMSKEQIEEGLKKYLGASNIIWLDKGIINDHTDGHVDEVARFVDERTIVCAYAGDNAEGMNGVVDSSNNAVTDDPNFALLDDNWRTLLAARDQDGRPFNLIKLPLPQMNYADGEMAPVSYTNFYIANEVVLVPQFQHVNDAVALQILQKLFPARRAIGIDCTDLIYGGGAIHCITQQQ